jgi:hypothetical protein
VFSRLVSFDSPEVIQEGMVFALETYWPATDGWSAARIEEQLVVTKTGCEVITRFPAEQLMVAGVKYHTATGPLSGTRETESHKNIDYRGVNYGGAGLPDKRDRAAPAADGHRAGRKPAPASKSRKARSR